MPQSEAPLGKETNINLPESASARSISASPPVGGTVDRPRLPVAKRDRLSSLDGLRGIAALVVVLYHCMATIPEFWIFMSLNGPRPEVYSPLWWMMSTPFRLITAGEEAVMVFFLLSGVVLTLPVLGNASFDWVNYFVARTARLWIPVVASVLLAALWISLVHQDPEQSEVPWVKDSSTPHLGFGLLARSMDPIKGSFRLNNPLWSLQWEFIFSLLLPVCICLAFWLRHWLALVLVACAALVAGGYWSHVPFLMHLPIFLVGSTMACNLSLLTKAGEKISGAKLSFLWWPLLLMAGATLLSTELIVSSMNGANEVVLAASNGLASVGAAMLVFVCAFIPGEGNVLKSRVVQWLGQLSFSLYLVHVPIIIFFNHLFGAKEWVIPLLIALPTIFVIAQFFYWVVERPSHRFSRFLGQRASERLTSYTRASSSAGRSR